MASCPRCGGYVGDYYDPRCFNCGFRPEDKVFDGSPEYKKANKDASEHRPKVTPEDYSLLMSSDCAAERVD